mgnify:CR=1 FL=1
MLDIETKGRINTARDILVGKVPDPKSQVEQITIALIYKFMDDMDVESEELGGKRTFFVGEYAKYAWRKIFDPRQSGYELLNLYSEAIGKMDTNPGVPKLFRDIFKNAYLPYRDPETLKSFLKIINEFDYSHSEKLGDAFEYLLSVLGSQGDAGQFRTPRHIIDFMVEIVDPKKNETILDPACGTAGFLISSYKHIIRQNSSNFNTDVHNSLSSNGDVSVTDRIISTNGYSGDKLTADDRKILARNIHGYDISPDMVRLSLVNMYLHGIKDPKIFEYDTLTSEDNWHHFSDVILANPPFMSPKGGIRPHKRFTVQSNRSEVLFVDYIAEHLTANGRAAVIVPEGIIFQSGKAYKQLRKKLVEECLVGVISLPAGVFNPYAGVKTSILWLDKALAKNTDKVLFVKIENDGFDLGAQRRAIKGNNIPAALQVISSYQTGIRSGTLLEFTSGVDIEIIPKTIITNNEKCNLSGEQYKEQVRVNSSFPLVTVGDVAEVISGQSPEGKFYNEHGEGMPFYQGKTEFGKRYIGAPQKWTTQVTKEAVEGDILMSVRAPVGPVNFASNHICIGRGLAAIRAKEIVLKEYLFYILRSKEGEIKGSGGAVFDSITKAQIEKIQIPLPPISVQEEIVAEVESYQKIIDGASQVVENYKPRIEIDPEWEKVELVKVCKIQSGGTPSRNISEYWNGEIPWVGSTVCKDSEVNQAEEYLTNLGLEKSAAKIFPTGTTLIALVGATIGKTGYLTFPCSTNQNIAGLIPIESGLLDNKFLFYIAQSLYPEFMKLGAGKFRMANLSFIRSLKVPLPDIQIQQEIVARLEDEMKGVKGAGYLVGSFEQKIKDRIAKVWGE